LRGTCISHQFFVLWQGNHDLFSDCLKGCMAFYQSHNCGLFSGFLGWTVIERRVVTLTPTPMSSQV
jgi:hypothetical protein